MLNKGLLWEFSSSKMKGPRYLFDILRNSLRIMFVKMRIHCSLFTIHSNFFLYIHSPLLQQNNQLLWFCFSSANQTAVQFYILWDHSGVRIGFNMNNKCYTLPIVYNMLYKFVYKHVYKFQSLFFHSELNEVHISYVWILKRTNLHCNKINLISVLNFLKQ